jgi:D-arabinose 1-dehydrogenase-like Zn-dependent alcohol dehydrogenase
MGKMRAVQVSKKGGPFEFVERDIVDPRPGTVRLKVEACGICHSDMLTKEGIWPGIEFPRVPGHEVAGVIDAIGSGMGGWKVGDRVGVGWHGGHCGYCDACRRGEFLFCSVAGRITGITTDGGYSEYMIAPSGVLAHIPQELSAAEAAPLMCAGVTTYNSLRNSGARGGDTVAVLGIGGLGHLGVQFASNMGFRTIAIARGKDKAGLAKELGAHIYIDSQNSDPAAELNKLGGAKIILATVTNAKAMTATLSGLAIDGKLVVLGAPQEPLEVPAGLLIGGRRSVSGWPSGTSIDSEDTLRFCALTGIRSRNELFPIDQVEKAYARMMSGSARFRVVLTL